MTGLYQRVQIWDEQTILAIIARREERLTDFMKAVSMAGDGYLWAVLAVVFYALTDVTAEWLTAGIFAFGIELACYKLIKRATSRKRPFRQYSFIQNLVTPPDEFSFPSGHTAAATVAALLFGTAIPALVPLFFMLAALIGLSRIYLGVHYPSDVIMGCVLGIFSFILPYHLF